MYCPLMRGRENTKIGYCVEKECMFTDKSGKCLIKQALQYYVEKAHLENEEKKTFTKTYISKPYQFLEPGDTSPAKLQHGGVYDDLSELRNAHATPPTDVNFGPPRVDGSYTYF